MNSVYYVGILAALFIIFLGFFLFSVYKEAMSLFHQNQCGGNFLKRIIVFAFLFLGVFGSRFVPSCSHKND